MSTKKNLVVPKLKKQTLGKINPRKQNIYIYPGISAKADLHRS